MKMMNRFGKKQLLGMNVALGCDKCAARNMRAHHDHPQELLDIVKDITSHHKKGDVGEEAYLDLLRYVISIYIQVEVERMITHKLDKTLCDKLSPKNLLDALV